MMTRFIYLSLLLIVLSCKDEPSIDANNPDQIGCLKGVNKNSPGSSPVLIRCCTKREYLAGSNVNAGGTANWTNYTNHQWTAVASCGVCN